MKTKLIAALAAVLALSACSGVVDAEYQQERETDRILAEAAASIGMPRIKNFTEKRLATRTMEMRDSEIATFAYLQGIDGTLVCLGPTIGFGIPYATQLTNPQKYEYQGATLPQAEPNGLYMPESAAATWIVLATEDGKGQPVYVEPNVIVSPVRLTGPAVKAQCQP